MEKVVSDTGAALAVLYGYVSVAWYVILLEIFWRLWHRKRIHGLGGNYERQWLLSLAAIAALPFSALILQTGWDLAWLIALGMGFGFVEMALSLFLSFFIGNAP